LILVAFAIYVKPCVGHWKVFTMTTFGPDQFTAVYRSAISKVEKKLLDKSTTGKQREEIVRFLDEIRSDLAKADAAYAHTVGFPICHCKLPGVPMLWRESESAHVCPSCDHRKVSASHAAKVGMSSRDRYLARRGQSDNDWDIFTGK
jgi:hypothetical protein